MIYAYDYEILFLAFYTITTFSIIKMKSSILSILTLNSFFLVFAVLSTYVFQNGNIFSVIIIFAFWYWILNSLFYQDKNNNI